MRFIIKYRRLFFQALIIAILVLTGNQLFIQFWLNKKNEEGLIINIAGRQRMLSQRINLLILRDNTNKQELDSLIQLWKKNHEGLLHTNKSLSFHKIDHLESEILLNELSENLKLIEDLTQKKPIDDDDQGQINKLIDDYLVKMDGVVYTLSDQADDRLHMIVIIELVLFSISIGMLLIEMRFIFFPVITRLGKTIDEKEALLKEKKSNVLYKHTEYLKSLHAITISRETSEEKIDQILDLLSSYFGLPVGIVSKIKDQQYKVMFSTLNELGIVPGDTYQLPDTICDITLNHSKTNVLFNDQLIFYDPDLQTSSFSNHKAIQSLPLKTYIGVAIYLNNQLYGTINFSSIHTKESYEEEEILMFLQGKEAIVYELQRIERRKLQQENEQLAVVARKTNNAIVISDRFGKVLWINEGFTKLTGYNENDIAGAKPESLLVDPKTKKSDIQKLRKAFETGRPLQMETMNYTKNGDPYWVSIDLQPIKNETGEVDCFVTLETDITEKIAEQKNELASEIRGEEKERNRISRDLHDGVGQMLVASRLLLGKVNMDTPIIAIIKQKEVLNKLIGEMIAETRMIINNLGVSLGKSEDFKEALTDLIEKSYRVFNGKIDLEWQGEQEFGDFMFSINLFRIIQEALNNCIKYSYASTIKISVHNNESIRVIIEDDGDGFDVNDQRATGGSGLSNMQTRADGLNLILKIESEKEKGTKITLTS